MRDPANFVVVDGAAAEMYCDSYGAGHLGPILLEGSHSVIERLRDTEAVDDFDPWCAAVVLIDIRRRVLGVHGRLDMSSFEGALTPSTYQLRYAYRAAYRALLTHAWPGWDLRWAYGGIADIVRYLGNRYRGAERDRPRSSSAQPVRCYDPERDEQDASLLLTIAGPDTPRQAYLLHDCDGSALGMGAALLAALPAADRVTELPYPPDSGAHLNPRTRQALLWTIAELRTARALWPGWRLAMADDRYDAQLALCGGEVFILEPDMDSAWTHLTHFVDDATISGIRSGAPLTHWPALVTSPGPSSIAA